MKQYKSIVLIVVFSLIVFSSCSNLTSINITSANKHETDLSTELKLSSSEQKNIIDNFTKLINSSDNLADSIDFIEENIKKLSKDKATDMLLLFEIVQSNYFTKANTLLDETKKNTDLYKIFKGDDISLDKLAKLSNDDTKDSIQKILHSGFKISCNGEIYHAYIDYSKYVDYSSYVNDDISQYFNIMAVVNESQNETEIYSSRYYQSIFDNSKACANFIEDFPDSSRYDVVKYNYTSHMEKLFLGENIENSNSNASVDVSDELKLFIDTVDLSNGSNRAVRDFLSIKTLLSRSDYKYDYNLKLSIINILDNDKNKLYS